MAIRVTTFVHATCVALPAGKSWRGILLRGPSGAGKSDLALRLVEAGGRARAALARQPADLIVLDGNAPHLMAQHSLASDVVRFASRGEVRATVVAGKVLYKDGTFTTIDLDRLRAEASAGASYVRGIVEGKRYKPFPAF